MDRLVIQGGVPLRGEVEISGAKNAALPLMAASLLTSDTLVLSNIPHLADIASMATLLGGLGTTLEMDGHSPASGHTGHVLKLRSEHIEDITAPYDIVRKMRASVLVLGPLLARFGEARVSLPGGCAIGTRPIDLHLHALEQLGAVITLEEGYVHASVPGGRLKGGEIHFEKVSVGATENTLMAAALADGTTILHNAAREPEIGDLIRCLQSMGANIEGIDSDRIIIHGVPKLHGAQHKVVADRIEMGSYAIAAAMTRGNILIRGGSYELLGGFSDKLAESGVLLEEEARGLRVSLPENAPLRPADIETHPFPGFATDMQAQFMALMCMADGASVITESIFENRFMHVPELMRMGAHITLRGHTAMVRGKANFTGASVMATDLRASVSLVLAALAAEGETIISRIYHLDRGYERIEEKLSALGAQIRRIH